MGHGHQLKSIGVQIVRRGFGLGLGFGIGFNCVARVVDSACARNSTSGRLKKQRGDRFWYAARLAPISSGVKTRPNFAISTPAKADQSRQYSERRAQPSKPGRRSSAQAEYAKDTWAYLLECPALIAPRRVETIRQVFIARTAFANAAVSLGKASP